MEQNGCVLLPQTTCMRRTDRHRDVWTHAFAMSKMHSTLDVLCWLCQTA